MNTENLILKHEIAVKELKDLELNLIDLIALTGDGSLFKLFSDWQDKRSECNDLYLKWLDSLAAT